MTVLVTGNLGYVGSVLTPMLSQRGHQVRGLDSGFFKDCLLSSEVEPPDQVIKDIRDIERADLDGIKAIVHLAGLSNDPLGELDESLTEAAVLRFAAAVEALSEHPIAQGVATAVERPLPVEDFRAIPGKGVEGTVEGRFVQVVSPGYVRAQGIAIDDPRYETLSAQGKTVVFVLLDGQLAGAVALAAVIRPEARGAIAEQSADPELLLEPGAPFAPWAAARICALASDRARLATLSAAALARAEREATRSTP